MDGELTATGERAARRLLRRVNGVMLLDHMAAPLFCAGAFSAFAVYLMRRLEAPVSAMASVAVLSVVCCVVYCVMQCRRKWFRACDARAYLDEQLGLHGALSAAAEGLGGGSSPPSVKPDRFRLPVYRWRSYESFYWIAAGLALLCMGAALPVAKPEQESPAIVSLPPSLAAVEEWIAQLESNEGIDDRTIDPFREHLDEFYRKPLEDAYTHAGLEAGDALRDSLRSTMMEFGRDMQKLDQALGEYQSQVNQGREADLKDLSEALKSLENCALQPGGQLAGDVAGINPDNLRQMTPDQISQMRDRLREMNDCMNGMCRNGMIPDPDQADGQMPVPAPGQWPDGAEPDRGRGDAPLAFKEDVTPAIEGMEERVSNEDLSRAGLGEQVGLRRGAHETDPGMRHAAESSSPASGPAQGGEATWSEDIAPREREALQMIFR